MHLINHHHRLLAGCSMRPQRGSTRSWRDPDVIKKNLNFFTFDLIFLTKSSQYVPILKSIIKNFFKLLLWFTKICRVLHNFFGNCQIFWYVKCNPFAKWASSTIMGTTLAFICFCDDFLGFLFSRSLLPKSFYRVRAGVGWLALLSQGYLPFQLFNFTKVLLGSTCYSVGWFILQSKRISSSPTIHFFQSPPG